jgi:hypothetical protein
MDRKSTDRRLNPWLPLLLLGGLALTLPLQLAAQVPVDENGSPLEALDPFDYTEPTGQAVQPLTATELEDLVGPIALYPDDLLAIVLPASTYPLEIVQAARFLDELATDSSLEPDESWDESVIALLNYPEVVYMMDKEVDWTWRLGEAVINQQEEILAAVESFRDRAYAAGNLESDERQTVSNDDGVIEIAPVDEEIIYVPYYEPEEVIVYQPRRVYHYYPQAYPVYYYPYPVGYSFASGYFWGVTTAYTIGWPNRYLHVYHPSYWGHPSTTGMCITATGRRDIVIATAITGAHANVVAHVRQHEPCGIVTIRPTLRVTNGPIIGRRMLIAIPSDSATRPITPAHGQKAPRIARVNPQRVSEPGPPLPIATRIAVIAMPIMKSVFGIAPMPTGREPTESMNRIAITIRAAIATRISTPTNSDRLHGTRRRRLQIRAHRVAR